MDYYSNRNSEIPWPKKLFALNQPWDFQYLFRMNVYNMIYPVHSQSQKSWNIYNLRSSKRHTVSQHAYSSCIS